MKYIIAFISVLMLSGTNYPQSSYNMNKTPREINSVFFSIDSYQSDYVELQRKSINIDNTVKKILSTVKLN